MPILSLNCVRSNSSSDRKFETNISRTVINVYIKNVLKIQAPEIQGQVSTAVPMDVYTVAYGVTPTVKPGNLMIATRSMEIRAAAPSQNSGISSSGCRRVFHIF